MSLDAEIAAQINDPRRLRAVRESGLLDTPAEEPFDRLARLAATVLDAPFAFVTVVDERRSFWKSCIGINSTELADRQNTVEESFCQYVIGSDSELVVGDTASDPRTRDNPSITKMDVAAWAGFPIRAPNGEALGSFCVVDTRTRTWTKQDVATLRTLADVASGEIALRAAGERAAGLARTLQQTLLPPVTPSVPGLDIGSVYGAAGSGVEVLGDFYDVFESADGRWNAVLGDVSGSGVDAARMTGLARYTLRGGAMRERIPSRALMQLDEAIHLDGSFNAMFVTAILATFDPAPDGFKVTLAAGGHTEAVLRRTGSCELVRAPGTILGVLSDPYATDVAFDFHPGDVLVLYTDGVIEARNDDGERFETGRLLAAVSADRGDAQGIADAIAAQVIAFGGEVLRDDVAILVLRAQSL